MPCSRFLAQFVFATVAVISAPSVGQLSKVNERLPKPVREAAPPKHVPITDIRVRLIDRGGVFLVYDADPIGDDSIIVPGFAAYWGDWGTGDLYIYERLLFDSLDVAQALNSLKRDIGIDPLRFDGIDETYVRKHSLAYLSRVPKDDTEWILADKAIIQTLLGVDDANLDSFDRSPLAPPPGGGCDYCQRPGPHENEAIMTSV